MSEPSARQTWPVAEWREGDLRGGAEYGAMVDALRGFLDAVAAAGPDEATVAALTQDLAAWTGRLAAQAVAERDQAFGRRLDLPGRGQSLCPTIYLDPSDAASARGQVTFGRYFLGGNGAAHGGALPLVFDELLGQLANPPGRAVARTAYLNVNYRAITPIDRPVEIRGWIEREEGRKRLTRGEIWDGERLCADAEALFVELKPGQP